MRHRLIDIALVVGLVLVAGAIVWTLFSLGRDPSPEPGPDAGPAVETPAPADGEGVVPVAPGGGPVGDGAGAAVDGDEDAAANGGAGDAADGADAGADGGEDAADPDAPDGAEAAADGDDGGGEDADDEDAQEAAGPAGDRPDPEVPAAEAPPLPESGPVELGRIGFSYVTGGAGACGIVLEAWQHVAVSREMLEAYGCGAEVRIALDEEVAGRTSFDAVIADTMNPAFSRTVNVYVGEDEPAFEFGLTSGTLLPQ